MAKTNQTYVNNPGYCPVCGSCNIEGQEVFIDGHQKVLCFACGASWTDYYSLTAYGDLKDADGNEIEVEYD